MEIYQLKTFVVVAREGSITRASEQLHLSQPAVSAHVKALEETLGLALFDRTARGMRLTRDGRRLLVKAEQTLGAHREMLDEATRIKGKLTGRLRVGVGANSGPEGIGQLLTMLSERCPEVEVSLKQADSHDVIDGLLCDRLDAGFYNETTESDPRLTTVQASTFGIYLVAPPGLVTVTQPPNWAALADVPWICPTVESCCGRAAESLFRQHGIRPQRIISTDRESVTRTLIAAGIGVGLLHGYSARAARSQGEVEIVCEARRSVRVLFAHLASRAGDPLLEAATSIVRAASA